MMLDMARRVKIIFVFLIRSSSSLIRQLELVSLERILQAIMEVTGSEVYRNSV